MFQELKKLRSDFRELARNSKLGKFNNYDIEILCENLVREDFESLVTAFTVQDDKTISNAQKKKASKLFEKHRDRIQAIKKEEKRKADELLAKQKLESRRSKEKLEKKQSIWTAEEELMLQKAIVRYPPGAGKRWQKIADMINTVGDKTTKEVIRRAKERSYKKETGTSASFDQYKKAVGRKKETLERTKPNDPSSHGWELESRIQGQEKKKAPVTLEWTADQQFQFEQALKTVPKGSDRWNKIAEAVEGKTKKDCVRRFKEIRARILAQKK